MDGLIIFWLFKIKINKINIVQKVAKKKRNGSAQQKKIPKNTK